jgi:choline dehydrogenase
MNNPNGVRMSTALTYINPNRHRLNLTIRPNVQASRIRFDGRKATGVEVESGGETFIVEGEQIVLCSGAIASPQLLMLSGVGPAAHLNSMGIPLVHDLPGVGQNLRDHPLVPIRVSVKEGFQRDPEGPRIQTVLRYTAGGSDARNDMQIFPSSYATPLGGDPFLEEGIRLTCMLELASSAGEVRLTSVDFKVQPYIDCRYLEEPWDRERLREGVRIALNLMEHESFKDIVEGLISPTEQDLVSDDALDVWLLENVWIGQHLSGTCKMGPASDPLAVVDQYCRVHGIEGLRVADASIMPDVIRANTNLTTIMIGERVADWIASH